VVASGIINEYIGFAIATRAVAPEDVAMGVCESVSIAPVRVREVVGKRILVGSVEAEAAAIPEMTILTAHVVVQHVVVRVIELNAVEAVQ
jgi:hypothetical protein